MLVVEKHPLIVVENIIARHGDGLTFTYSRYEIAQPGFQGMAPRSAVLRVRGRDVTSDWVDDRLHELRLNEELAWHSWVEREGGGFHIPMIDLVNSPPPSSLRELSRMLATDLNLGGDFIFFVTGQSFLGYFPDLISERTWLTYLGQLLLLDKHDRPPIIDTRWVGHALARGFSALRWSNNTNRYRAMPRLSSVFDATGT
jgi:hypothetical protein